MGRNGADDVLVAAPQSHAGTHAALVGAVRDGPPGRVIGLVECGWRRTIDTLVGNPLPPRVW